MAPDTRKMPCPSTAKPSLYFLLPRQASLPGTYLTGEITGTAAAAAKVFPVRSSGAFCTAIFVQAACFA